VNNPDEGFNTARYNDMVAKANEIKTLTIDEQLIKEVDKHLQSLERLQKEISEEALNNDCII
jgi:hypothetical protein